MASTSSRLDGGGGKNRRVGVSMTLYERLLIEREIAPQPMPGEDVHLMMVSREIAEGKRALPDLPAASTIRKSILAAMKADHCE